MKLSSQTYSALNTIPSENQIKFGKKISCLRETLEMAKKLKSSPDMYNLVSAGEMYDQIGKFFTHKHRINFAQKANNELAEIKTKLANISVRDALKMAKGLKEDSYLNPTKLDFAMSLYEKLYIHFKNNGREKLAERAGIEMKKLLGTKLEQRLFGEAGDMARTIRKIYYS